MNNVNIQFSSNIVPIGNYLIFRDPNHRLGSGQYGEVYLGTRKDNQSVIVAIKIIQKKGCNPISVKREVDIMQSLSHPNIINFYYAGESSFEIFLVFEYCKGGSLDSYLNKRKTRTLPEAESYQIIKQIVCAMNYCLSLEENHRVIHRDLKPENILIHEQGVIKLCDFGLARFFEGDPNAIQQFTVVGSPIYMALEVLKGDAFCSKCDVWSVGIIFYECLIGRVPWIDWQNWNSKLQLIAYIEKWNIENDEGLLKLSVKKEIKDIIKRMLVKDQEKRADFMEVALFFEREIDFFRASNVNQIEITEIFPYFETFHATFEENQKALEEFDHVDDCHISRNLKYTMNLSQTQDKFVIEVDLITNPLNQTQEEFNNMQNAVKNTLDSLRLLKKSEEFFSFRLNLVFYLRRLVNSLLLFWKSLEDLIKMKAIDFIEILVALKRLEILILLELVELLDKTETKENNILSEFYKSQACSICYEPLARKNLEIAKKIYTILMDDSKNFQIDKVFKSPIIINKENLEFTRTKTEIFFQTYAKNWLIEGVDKGNVKALMILKQFVIGRNIDVLMEHFKCEEEEMYVNEFYAIYAEIRNPKIEELNEFLIKKIK